MVQWGYKTILNASYGVFAETKHGYTPLTNLIYASYITAITRIKIYEIIDRVGWKHVKAIMTDAVITDIEIEDADFNSNELGKFKLEGKFDRVWLYQNGIYISLVGNRINLHNRGFPSLTKAEQLFNAKGQKIRITRDKKVVKIKEGIIRHKEDDIGKFTTENKVLNLSANRWKYNLDEDKLTFEYLKDNELTTDYFYNTELEYAYSLKPYEKPIDFESLKDRFKKLHTKPVKTYAVTKTDYGALLDKITNSNKRTRDFRRFVKKYERRLDVNLRILTSYGDKEIWFIVSNLLYAV